MDGREYRSDVVGFGAVSDTESSVRELITLVRERGEVWVYYDPSSPASSTLRIGVSTATVVSLVFAVVWLLLMTAFALIPFFASP